MAIKLTECHDYTPLQYLSYFSFIYLYFNYCATLLGVIFTGATNKYLLFMDYRSLHGILNWKRELRLSAFKICRNELIFKNIIYIIKNKIILERGLIFLQIYHHKEIISMLNSLDMVCLLKAFFCQKNFCHTVCYWQLVESLTNEALWEKAGSLEVHL